MKMCVYINKFLLLIGPASPTSSVLLQQTAARAVGIGSPMAALREAATRCLGMLFDIFPDCVTARLLATKASDGTDPPSLIVAKLLSYGYVSGKNTSFHRRCCWLFVRLCGCAAVVEY